MLVAKPENIHIVVNERHVPLAKQQISELGIKIPDENILTEPVPRDTLPAVIYALMHIPDDPPVAMMPADQYIRESERLADAIRKAVPFTEKYIVAIGVTPTEPDTGYGYMRIGRKIGDGIYQLLEFKEKPDLETARRYVDEGYLWNTFIHVFRKSIMLNEIKRYAEETYRIFEKYRDEPRTAYSIVSPSSLSSEVLEKTDRNAVIPVNLTWSDMGSFDRLHKLAEKDENGNAYNVPLIAIDAKNNYVQINREDKTVAIIGLNNIFVIDTRDAIIVGDNRRAQDVKQVFKILERNHGPVHHHLRIPAEWGGMEMIDYGKNSSIGKILIDPGRTAKIKIEAPQKLIILRGTVKINGKTHADGAAVDVQGSTVTMKNIGDSAAEILQIRLQNTANNPYMEILKEIEG
ncbi:MAG: hypothetical protein GXN93_04560 [Candidatus Diapherotrites archaeon]|nr:hypothetical protein [Candidatus Diapherotrites archaeon]